jgi:hypothetical protein
MRGFMGRFSVIVLIGLMACGGDDNSGPSTADVNGDWDASLSNMSGSGIACSSITPTVLTLTGTGTTFSGTYNGGQLTCSGPGGTFTETIGSGSVINGQVNGSNLSFDLDTPDFHHTGTVSESSMSGTARWTIDFGSPIGVVELNGNWGASQQF